MGVVCVAHHSYSFILLYSSSRKPLARDDKQKACMWLIQIADDVLGDASHLFYHRFIVDN